MGAAAVEALGSFSRMRVGTGQISEGGVSFPLHFYLLFCTICFKPMRFPRVKAEGQGFYHCVSRVVDRQFIFQTAGHGSPEAERFVLSLLRLCRGARLSYLTCPSPILRKD